MLYIVQVSHEAQSVIKKVMIDGFKVNGYVCCQKSETGSGRGQVTSSSGRGPRGLSCV